MAAAVIALKRLFQQRLSQNPLATPNEIVQALGAVQAQDYPGAKWALALRMDSAENSANTPDDVIERAFNEGSILRTHVMRPTWHFVAPADIRWILELTAPRVNAINAYLYRQQELDDALFARSNAIIASALQGGQQLTRAELGSALAQAGIVAEGLRLIYIVMRAELDAIVCSGPRHGKQFTYMLLDERAPQARILRREESLAELAKRYFISHGPATARDFAWWSGLTVTNAKVGLEMVAADLDHEVIDDQTYWFSASIPPLTAAPSPTALLLPTYDEFLVGYAGFDKLRRGGRESNPSNIFDPTLVIDGQVVGSWRRTFSKGAVVIELSPFAPLTSTEDEAVSAAIRRYGEFLNMPVVVF
ncbi:MAG: winged helix DNA-binding domain-containing protein [Chloroflexota bacterium]